VKHLTSIFKKHTLWKQFFLFMKIFALNIYKSMKLMAGEN
jgi:hypothetical protein